MLVADQTGFETCRSLPTHSVNVGVSARIIPSFFQQCLLDGSGAQASLIGRQADLARRLSAVVGAPELLDRHTVVRLVKGLKGRKACQHCAAKGSAILVHAVFDTSKSDAASRLRLELYISGAIFCQGPLHVSNSDRWLVLQRHDSAP